MRNFFRFTFFTLTLTTFLLASCVKSDNQDECTFIESGGVTSISGANIGEVNEIISIEVKFGVGNGCGQFNRFVETDLIGNEKTIGVEAIYIGCVCTQDAPIRTVIYEFSTSISGNYTLKFKESSGTFIEHQITIN